MSVSPFSCPAVSGPHARSVLQAGSRPPPLTDGTCIACVLPLARPQKGMVLCLRPRGTVFPACSLVPSPCRVWVLGLRPLCPACFPCVHPREGCWVAPPSRCVPRVLPSCQPPEGCALFAPSGYRISACSHLSPPGSSVWTLPPLHGVRAQCFQTIQAKKREKEETGY